MHHAYFLLGSLSWALTKLPEDERNPSADVVFYEGERMGIDEVHSLIHEASRMPLVRTHRTFILAYPLLTEPAQNALLKLLEEPPSTARFYIIVSREVELIPTLRSRLLVLGKQGGEIDSLSVFEAFNNSSQAERLALIASRAIAHDDVWMSALLDGIEKYAEKRKNMDLLADIVMTRRYFDLPGASKKMLLEQLALTLP